MRHVSTWPYVIMTTLDLAACAEFLKIHRTTVLKLAASGELPGAKIGRAWVFLRTDLEAYLRGMIDSQREKRQAAVSKSLVMPSPYIVIAPVKRSRRKAIPELPQLLGQA